SRAQRNSGTKPVPSNSCNFAPTTSATATSWKPTGNVGKPTRPGKIAIALPHDSNHVPHPKRICQIFQLRRSSPAHWRANYAHVCSGSRKILPDRARYLCLRIEPERELDGRVQELEGVPLFATYLLVELFVVIGAVVAVGFQRRP